MGEKGSGKEKKTISVVKAAALTSWRTSVKEEVSLVNFMAPHCCGCALIHMDVRTTVLFLLAARLLWDIIHIAALNEWVQLLNETTKKTLSSE